MRSDPSEPKKLASLMRRLEERRPREKSMEVYIALQPLVALVAGILILVMPRLLNYIVALYLIIIGILGLLRY